MIILLILGILALVLNAVMLILNIQRRSYFWLVSLAGMGAAVFAIFSALVKLHGSP